MQTVFMIAGVILGGLIGNWIGSRFDLFRSSERRTGYKIGDAEVTEEVPGCGCFLVLLLAYLGFLGGGMLHSQLFQ